MRINTISIVLFLIIVETLSCQQSDPSSIKKQGIYQKDRPALAHADTIIKQPIIKLDSIGLEIPKCNKNDKVISHHGYTFLYSESHEQASWVAYELSSFETKSLFKRSNKFCEDPYVSTGTATLSDYKHSGFDRGHLAPAADMGWSSLAMNESFYFSNISPQVPSFNQGIWKKLEELVRLWAVESKAIYIVTGPILSEGLASIGPNKVSVPKYFYKVILDYSKPEYKGIGLIIPNTGSHEMLQNFVVSIDSVEKLTSLDFFPKLPDHYESQLESKVCASCWTWAKPSHKKNQNKSNSLQCLATTKSGLRCKRMTRNLNSICTQHNRY